MWSTALGQDVHYWKPPGLDCMLAMRAVDLMSFPHLYCSEHTEVPFGPAENSGNTVLPASLFDRSSWAETSPGGGALLWLHWWPCECCPLVHTLSLLILNICLRFNLCCSFFQVRSFYQRCHWDPVRQSADLFISALHSCSFHWTQVRGTDLIKKMLPLSCFLQSSDELFFPSDTCCSTTPSHQPWWVCPVTSSSSPSSSSSAMWGFCGELNRCCRRHWSSTYTVPCHVSVELHLRLHCLWQLSFPCCLQQGAAEPLSGSQNDVTNNQQVDNVAAGTERSWYHKVVLLFFNLFYLCEIWSFWQVQARVSNCSNNCEQKKKATLYIWRQLRAAEQKCSRCGTKTWIWGSTGTVDTGEGPTCLRTICLH